MSQNNIKRYLAIGIVVLLTGLMLLFSFNSTKPLLEWGFFNSVNFKIQNALELLGGLGLFLFGIKFLGEGLQLLAGEKIKEYIAKSTSNPFKGFLLGFVVTTLIQSSSGSTALVVALVSVGLMTFKQSMAVIVGANVGTTTTSILIGFKIKKYIWLFMAIGGLFYMFAKKEKIRHMAQAIFGFGILFLGLATMGAAMKPLIKEEWFKSLILTMDSPNWIVAKPLSIFLGAALTVLVQSSSAFIGIVQSLHGEKILGSGVVIPMIIGANIGTTITAFLASLGTNIYAKRTAFFHSLFNVLGAFLFLSFLFALEPLILSLVNNDQYSSFLIPTTHALFNLILTIIFLPTLHFWSKIVKKVIKPKEGENEEYEMVRFDNELANSAPSSAINIVNAATSSILKLSSIQLKEIYNCFRKGEKSHFAKGKNIGIAIEEYNFQMLRYINLVSKNEINDDQSQDLTTYTLISRDIERIFQLNKTLIVFSQKKKDAKTSFSQEAYDELKAVFQLTIEIGEKTSMLINKYSKTLYKEICDLEEKLDDMEKVFKSNHIARLRKHKTSKVERYFHDALTNLERIADHYKMIGSFFSKKLNKTSNKVDINLINKLIAQK